MKRAIRNVTGWALAVLAVAGCSSLEITAPPLQVIEEIEFHPTLNVDLSEFEQQPSGIYLQTLEEGEGDLAQVETTVDVAFEGYLATTGNLFVRDRAAVILGVGEIPPGLDEAIQGMRVGGTRRAIIPPLLGYGRLPVQNIPGGSVLVYEIELFEVLGGS